METPDLKENRNKGPCTFGFQWWLLRWQRSSRAGKPLCTRWARFQGQVRKHGFPECKSASIFPPTHILDSGYFWKWSANRGDPPLITTPIRKFKRHPQFLFWFVFAGFIFGCVRKPWLVTLPSETSLKLHRWLVNSEKRGCWPGCRTIYFFAQDLSWIKTTRFVKSAQGEGQVPWPRRRGRMLLGRRGRMGPCVQEFQCPSRFNLWENALLLPLESSVQVLTENGRGNLQSQMPLELRRILNLGGYSCFLSKDSAQM